MKPNKRERNPTQSPKRTEMNLNLADALGQRRIAPKDGNPRFQIETLASKASQNQLQGLQRSKIQPKMVSGSKCVKSFQGMEGNSGKNEAWGPL